MHRPKLTATGMHTVGVVDRVFEATALLPSTMDKSIAPADKPAIVGNAIVLVPCVTPWTMTYDVSL